MTLDCSSLAATDGTDVLEDARRVLRRERRELEDERIAFDRFRQRVQQIESTQPPQVDSARRLHHGGGLERVRDAYVETVMSVPHYFDRYDESVAESLAGELSEELAAAVTRGTVLHPRLKRSLVDAARHAVDTRDTILEMIDDELEEVERTEAIVESMVDELVSLTSQPLDRLEFNALRLTRVRLRRLRDRCDDLAVRRQEFVRRNRRTPLATGRTFSAYLYGECESTHPILSVIAALGESIDRVMSHVERKLSSTR